MMELLYWPSENKWNLPSIDVESLHLLAYIKFSGANVNTTPTLKSLLQNKGRSLPCLCLPEDELITSRKEIIKYLKLKYFDADTWLSDEQRSYGTALSALIEDKLLPAVQATLWLDNANYTDVVRPVFARNCRYPINFTEAKKIHDNFDEFLGVVKSMEGEDVEMKLKKLQGEATEAIVSISAYLKERECLFGNRVSSIDALLFSCLAPLVKMPLSSGSLHNEVRKSSNLVQYVERILSRYFKEERQPVKDSTTKDEKQPKTETSNAASSETSETNEFKYDWVLSVSVAAIAMVSYAINSGLLTVSTS